MPRSLQSLPARFWTFVIKGSEPKACWGWKGATHEFGYGLLGAGLPKPNRVVRAHRLSWEIHFGPIPKGQMVLHKCDQPACTNPKHLFTGDAKANTQDALKKGRLLPPPIRRGGSNGNSKLTAKTVRRIRAASNAGLSLVRVAERFSCSKKQVLNIIHRRQWAHLS